MKLKPELDVPSSRTGEQGWLCIGVVVSRRFLTY